MPGYIGPRRQILGFARSLEETQLLAETRILTSAARRLWSTQLDLELEAAIDTLLATSQKLYHQGFSVHFDARKQLIGVHRRDD